LSWGLACLALAVLAVAAVSRRLSGTPVTSTMVFVVIGVLVGPEVLGAVDVAPTGETVRTLAEATLAVVLFSDASRIKLPALRRESAVPLRLLGIGLPLTIALGAVLAAAFFDEFTVAEALVLAVLLAPTDAALGQAVVTEPRLPSRIRQGLNVESGLNDGICVPLLFIVLASAEVASDVSSGHHAISIVFEEIGYGIVGGVGAGVLASAIVGVAGRRALIAGEWLQVIPVAAAALAYGLAAALGGSGFIAAFLAGMIFGSRVGREAEEAGRLSEELGSLLNGVTFVVFGAVLLGPALPHLTWRIVAYAALSLTLVRMIPVAIAMLGTGARRPTIAFVGWFGPRGLASIVFAVIVVEQSHLPQTSTIVLVTYATVGLSVLAHGLTAAPLTGRYVHWYESHPLGALLRMESVPAAEQRVRGAHDPGDGGGGGRSPAQFHQGRPGGQSSSGTSPSTSPARVSRRARTAARIRRKG
jgi:NhaP-type Na+/H+ or K+/H+ antiporter